MKRTYQIDFEWKIQDTRDAACSYKTGTSCLIVKASNKEDAINHAIDFAQSLPSWEFIRNSIDIEEYREGKICRYYYSTQILKILKVKVVG